MVPKLKKKELLTIRKPGNVDHGRLRMANTSVWEQHFGLLQAAIDKLGLRDKPNATFNCNVSMSARDKKLGKVVVSRRTKHSYSESKGTRDHITECMHNSLRGHITVRYNLLSSTPIWPLS